jgi:hypothetical protein
MAQPCYFARMASKVAHHPGDVPLLSVLTQWLLVHLPVAGWDSLIGCIWSFRLLPTICRSDRGRYLSSALAQPQSEVNSSIPDGSLPVPGTVVWCLVLNRLMDAEAQT